VTISKIGPYTITEELGHGGMGRVYRARDPRLDRTVAIKFLLGPGSGDADRRLRFLREARAEAALHHPNIATVLDVGEAEVDLPELLPAGESSRGTKVPYLVLEFVPGDDLRTRLRAGLLPLPETLRLARQIVEGLRAAHALGIVHRDLKPGNIRVTPDGRAKILDFGLARYVAAEAPTTDHPTDLHTTEGIVLGTPPYMAPEQGLGLTIDARADLFALGVILYQMVGGEMPFHGEHTVELLQSVLRDDPRPLTEHAPTTPARLVALVHRLLAKSPNERPRNADEVARELDAIARELGDAPTVIEPSRVSRPLRSWMSAPREARSVRIGVAVLVLILAAVAAAIWFATSRRPNAEALAAFERGERAAELGDPQAARIAAELFERAAGLDPSFEVAWARASESWVDAYERDQQPLLLERADAAAARAEEIDAQSDAALLARARLLRVRGHEREALDRLGQLAPDSPLAWKAHAERARALEQSGDPEGAEQELLAAIAAREGYWGNWNDLGDFRIRTGNYAGARAAFDRAAELAPAEETQPRENLASLLFLEGNYDGALAAYEKIPLPAISPESASNLGTLYFFNGRMNEAENAFRRATRMAAREPLYHRNLADALVRLGRGEEAKAEYVEALRLVNEQLVLRPKSENLMLQRALYLARSGSCDEAVRFAGELDSQLADGARTQRALAQPLALCGAFSAAIAQLQRAVALGFARELLRDEDELAALRGLPEFDQLVGK
jgi:Flp pilus assembly protein TadD/tRNA A-37 threonylcarbamoyl transferase component Bud32